MRAAGYGKLDYLEHLTALGANLEVSIQGHVRREV